MRTTNSCIALGSADSEAPGDTLRQEREPTNQLQLPFGFQVVPDQHLAICTNTEEQEMGMGLLLVRDPCHLYNENTELYHLSKCTFRWQYYIIWSSDTPTLEIGSLCPRSLSPELARRGSVSMPMFQSRTSPLNVPPAIRAGWLGWNTTHIKQLCKVWVCAVTHLMIL